MADVSEQWSQRKIWKFDSTLCYQIVRRKVNISRGEEEVFLTEEYHCIESIDVLLMICL